MRHDDAEAARAVAAALRRPHSRCRSAVAAAPMVPLTVAFSPPVSAPLHVTQEEWFQLFRGSEILESAFEQRDDRLCVVRQLAELLRLPFEEVYSDFDAICPRNWQRKGVTGQQIREFCEWRKAPLFIVNCRGQMLDCYEPAESEHCAVACCVYRDHAFFYRNAKAVAFCDGEPRDQPKYRGERKESSVPLFRDWKEWQEIVEPGHFWTKNLQLAGAPAQGRDAPRVSGGCRGSGGLDDQARPHRLRGAAPRWGGQRGLRRPAQGSP